jgi:adenine-specific DNA-methyltransferase
MPKYNLGQYFTKNVFLKQKLYGLILNNPSNILEPCFGQGDLIHFVKSQNPYVSFDGYEIDESIQLLETLEKEKITFTYTDFLTANIEKKYDTIIGNPPYVKTKKGNLYIDFVEKCFHLLNECGELIFIVPSDFFKLTSSTKILNLMTQKGSFTHIYHPHDEKLFENASIDVLIFRYMKKKKNIQNKLVLYNDKMMYLCNSNGLITFQENEYTNESADNFLIKDTFHVCVGLVSGKDEIYKNETLGNILVINGDNKVEKYIFIEKFPSDDDKVNMHLLKHKQDLLSRKIKKFNESNWFEWGAPRNIGLIKKNFGKACLYLHNLSRKKKVAFIGKVNYFGGGLIMLMPKNDDIDLEKVENYLNSEMFKNKFTFSGRFKIGHRQISNSLIDKKIIYK